MSDSPNIVIPATRQAPSAASICSAPKVVILCDHDPARRQLVKQVIETCGATAFELQCAEAHRVEGNARQYLALVAWGDSHETRSLDAIRALRLKGYKVICYEDGLPSWQIGLRCRALLSGSFVLLDSAVSTFPEELRDALVSIWRNESERHSEEEQIKDQMRKFGIVSVSSQMLTVFRSVVRLSALSDFPVLICGETGTGKELVANSLYRLDVKRSKGPFIVANCAAISSELAESEFFGHRRGAFTGADTERKGFFRAAEGGVLFLDEIGELSLGLQAKLLRVLQEERVLGVGFDREVSIDVRVVAATNRNLEAMVREGTFREDLYHRLNVLSINVPPLRERKADLQPLTEHFLRKYASLNPRTTMTITTEFLEALGRMKLPGNARQLENIVRRALVEGSGQSSLSLKDFAVTEWELLAAGDDEGAIEHESEGSSLPTSQDNTQGSFIKILDLNGWNLSKSLEYCEKALLECALQFTAGNQSQTARLIGITPRSVYNKLQKHDLR